MVYRAPKNGGIRRGAHLFSFLCDKQFPFPGRLPLTASVRMDESKGMLTPIMYPLFPQFRRRHPNTSLIKTLLTPQIHTINWMSQNLAHAPSFFPTRCILNGSIPVLDFGVNWENLDSLFHLKPRTFSPLHFPFLSTIRLHRSRKPNIFLVFRDTSVKNLCAPIFESVFCIFLPYSFPPSHALRFLTILPLSIFSLFPPWSFYP